MVSKSYAQALFSIAKEDKVLDSCYDSFSSFIKLFDDAEFKSFFNSPKIDSDKKKEIILSACSSFNEIFIYFLRTLIDNDATSHTEDIYADFVELYNAYNNIKDVTVLSVEKLSKEEHDYLVSLLEKKYIGCKINLINKIDESLGSGYAIFADGKKVEINAKGLLGNLRKNI